MTLPVSQHSTRGRSHARTSPTNRSHSVDSSLTNRVSKVSDAASPSASSHRGGTVGVSVQKSAKITTASFDPKKNPHSDTIEVQTVWQGRNYVFTLTLPLTDTELRAKDANERREIEKEYAAVFLEDLKQRLDASSNKAIKSGDDITITFDEDGYIAFVVPQAQMATFDPSIPRGKISRLYSNVPSDSGEVAKGLSKMINSASLGFIEKELKSPQYKALKESSAKSNQAPSKSLRPIGIVNSTGVQCFYNAAFQQWVNNPVIRRELLSHPDWFVYMEKGESKNNEKSGENHPLYIALTEYVAASKAGKEKYTLKDLAELGAPLGVSPNRQSDADEALRVFMHHLDVKAMHQAKSPLCYELNNQYIVEGEEGLHGEQIEQGAIYSKTIPLKKNQPFAEQIVQSFTTTNDAVINDNKSPLHGKKITGNQDQFTQSPSVLIIEANRVGFNSPSSASKDLTEIDLGDSLEITLPEEVAADKPTYELMSFVVHNGITTGKGHYIAFIRDSKGGFWKIDDNTVELTDRDKFLDAAKNGTKFVFNKKGLPNSEMDEPEITAPEAQPNKQIALDENLPNGIKLVTEEGSLARAVTGSDPVTATPCVLVNPTNTALESPPLSSQFNVADTDVIQRDVTKHKVSIINRRRWRSNKVTFNDGIHWWWNSLPEVVTLTHILGNKSIPVMHIAAGSVAKNANPERFKDVIKRTVRAALEKAHKEGLTHEGLTHIAFPLIVYEGFDKKESYDLMKTTITEYLEAKSEAFEVLQIKEIKIVLTKEQRAELFPKKEKKGVVEATGKNQSQNITSPLTTPNPAVTQTSAQEIQRPNRVGRSNLTLAYQEGPKNVLEIKISDDFSTDLDRAFSQLQNVGPQQITFNFTSEEGLKLNAPNFSINPDCYGMPVKEAIAIFHEKLKAFQPAINVTLVLPAGTNYEESLKPLSSDI